MSCALSSSSSSSWLAAGQAKEEIRSSFLPVMYYILGGGEGEHTHTLLHTTMGERGGERDRGRRGGGCHPTPEDEKRTSIRTGEKDREGHSTAACQVDLIKLHTTLVSHQI